MLQVVEEMEVEALMAQVRHKLGHDNRAGIDGASQQLFRKVDQPLVSKPTTSNIHAGTLHRISVIYDRERLEALGATLRCGRHITGNVEPFRDLLDKDPQRMPSILVLGPPGTGKVRLLVFRDRRALAIRDSSLTKQTPSTQTTIIRELARVLSLDLCLETLIIDTSNEIAGDGRIAHSSVGRARRMMVRRVDFMLSVLCLGTWF